MASEFLALSSSCFYVKDCVIAPMATGVKARSLTEFCDRIKTIPSESLYYHFWRHAIETSLVPRNFYNDFSQWAHGHLHDDILAERLALIDPTKYADLELLRRDMLSVVEDRIEELDVALFCSYTDAFHFVKSKIIIFNTNYKIENPTELLKTLPLLSHSSFFYHFIDARKRKSQELDDFSSWLYTLGAKYQPLIDRFNQIDPYFIPLAELKQKIIAEVREYFYE